MTQIESQEMKIFNGWINNSAEWILFYIHNGYYFQPLKKNSFNSIEWMKLYRVAERKTCILFTYIWNLGRYADGKRRRYNETRRGSEMTRMNSNMYISCKSEMASVICRSSITWELTKKIFREGRWGGVMFGACKN